MRNKQLFLFVIISCMAQPSQLLHAEEQSKSNGFLKSLLSPPSEQDIFNDKIDLWVSEKSKDFLLSNSDKWPFYIDGEIVDLTTQKSLHLVSKINEALEPVVQNHKKQNPEENFRTVGSLSATASDLLQTQKTWNKLFYKYSDEFSGKIVAGNIFRLNNYCESKNIAREQCNSGVSANESTDISAFLIKSKFRQENPYIFDFYDSLTQLIAAIKSYQVEITNHSLAEEAATLIEIAKKNGCSSAQIGSNSGALLVSEATYSSFKPDPSVIYDLKGFIVQQSFDEGILISSSIKSYNITPRFYFVTTSNDYIDQHLLQAGEVFVCASGSKSYVDTLGRQRKVQKFKSIENNEKFYFLK
ncbi:hypothetical protein Rhein_3456 [Rheinheimera sp. A13L]|uniref:hypothetical protein n=1 Tax=Rheinheimera sp. A13L TaxID=506534 RepID=UPI0002124C4B|nr:hypothetical protein [Rheinheimera sp. A13L]EGM76394.1 hypothetical protein Rhein_3456 [Rheinheimera sp. A13L]